MKRFVITISACVKGSDQNKQEAGESHSLTLSSQSIIKLLWNGPHIVCVCLLSLLTDLSYPERGQIPLQKYNMEFLCIQLHALLDLCICIQSMHSYSSKCAHTCQPNTCSVDSYSSWLPCEKIENKPPPDSLPPQEQKVRYVGIHHANLSFHQHLPSGKSTSHASNKDNFCDDTMDGGSVIILIFFIYIGQLSLQPLENYWIIMVISKCKWAFKPVD